MSRHIVTIEKEAAVRDNTFGRLEELELSRKVLLVWGRNNCQVTLTNPLNHSHVEFFPTRGTVMRNHVKQFRRGLDHALKLIGIVV